ncbi:1-deoxy-D-xylulose-5-phosphate reductoisomerase [Alkalicella caledoniensis]|uniref:1-deoxy-D-xylulose 5-phosphate reductoisomerase n=1 Tax=Alkalicella caledoniensis TaxID=2731377 RepID=A0A7G9WCP2_ALKCA|nr:1-deoxy-D-xylulose-5-phosphate reductoisomerase [Alkalicella caledoniensis]QNO16454.1 1-deoxy-D-xylulose-5-phosphate reductoisomerase [Alkalicella caledoniensis]
MNIGILGSTGSVGSQTLDVVEHSPHIKVYSLVANSNYAVMEQQCRKFQPKLVAMYDEHAAKKLKALLSDTRIKVTSGLDGIIEACCQGEVDLVVSSIVGKAGLIPTYQAILHKKQIALANKETLVIAGHIITDAAKENKVDLLPVDSEHSAIFQCLQGNHIKDINKIILTASGGPFRGKDLDFLRNVTVEDTLKHPNWSMGKKITVDSATLINKGLEAIEAKWLFDTSLEKVEVVIHPQSIIHSAVEYIDGNVIAHLSPPDMKYAIQYALNYPKRLKNNFQKLNIFEHTLSFEKPNLDVFQGLNLCIESGIRGGNAPVVLNAANEVAVDYFLKGKIKFLEIPQVISETLEKHKFLVKPSLDEILEFDQWARITAKEQIERKGVI